MLIIKKNTRPLVVHNPQPVPPFFAYLNLLCNTPDLNSSVFTQKLKQTEVYKEKETHNMVTNSEHKHSHRAPLISR